ncbi:MAG: GIY-YIG nuclease family protein [Allobaculum sp.]|nr:GIY-YIG nuclease family protein [Allobaculum sp.]
MVEKTKITTFKPFDPKIYAYTTPNYAPNDGWLKIGYTEQDVDVRIRQQTQTAHLKAQKEWEERAFYRTPEVQPFKDHDFHRFLEKIGIERMKGEDGAKAPEFFRISPDDAWKRLQE